MQRRVRVNRRGTGGILNIAWREGRMSEANGSVGMKTHFVTCVGTDNTYLSRTLPMWAGEYLRELEGLFGPRDSSYCFLGVDFHEPSNQMPMNWYPDSGISNENPDQPSKHIVIHLALNAINNPNIARWQLAHECVHLLDPWNHGVEGRRTNILEEGLATWYQCRTISSVYLPDPNYIEANNLVTKYESSLPDAVKRIRANEHSESGKPIRIGDISPEILMLYCNQMGEVDAVRLCERFA